MKTAHEKIKVLAPVHIDIDPIIAELEILYSAARSNDIGCLMESLKRLVPEFKPTYNFTGEAPPTFQRVRPDLFPQQQKSGFAKVLPIRK